MQERAQGREPGIATSNRVLAVLLEVIQKREHEGRIQIGQHQALGRFVPAVASKLEQEPEAIAIGRHGLWTRVALANQPLQKELLDELGKLAFRGRGCLHWAAPPEQKRENRCDASLINIGVAEMYQ